MGRTYELDTYYASPTRLTTEELQRRVAQLEGNPVLDTLMNVTGGLLAVLNDKRQILLVNDAFVDAIGVEDAGDAFGLRPGEAVRCRFAPDAPSGCGTGEYCASCGAAVAIVSALADDEPAERLCALTVERDGRRADYAFAVRAAPVEIQGQRLVLLYLQDVTARERWASTEQAFYHDINNLLCGLHGSAALLAEIGGCTDAELAEQVQLFTERLVDEVEIQRRLANEERKGVPFAVRRHSVRQILRDLRSGFLGAAAESGVELRWPASGGTTELVTSLPLVLRVLTNMLKNAVEASGPGDAVAVWVEEQVDAVTFFVRNRCCIEPSVRGRVFQRHFSTKSGAGRGLGAYSMKLVGEGYLGGRVDFITSEEDGTTFSFRVPRKPSGRLAGLAVG